MEKSGYPPGIRVAVAVQIVPGDAWVRGVVTDPKHSVEMITLTDYSGVSVAVPKDALKGVAFANNTPYAFADNAIAASFANSKHAGALLADPNYAFEIVAE